MLDRKSFEKNFPKRLVDLHSHWLDEEKDVILFRPKFFREKEIYFITRANQAEEHYASQDDDGEDYYDLHSDSEDYYDGEDYYDWVDAYHDSEGYAEGDEEDYDTGYGEAIATKCLQIPEHLRNKPVDELMVSEDVEHQLVRVRTKASANDEMIRAPERCLVLSRENGVEINCRQSVMKSRFLGM